MLRLIDTAPAASVLDRAARPCGPGEETMVSSAWPSSPPSVGANGIDRLSSRALAYLNTRTVLEVAAGTAVLAVAASFLPGVPWRVGAWGLLAVLFVVALAIELPWLNRRQVALTSFTVTPDFVYVARGRVWRRTVVISTPQILNVESTQGPLARSFGVVFVRFTCLTDVEKVGPLDPATVDEIRRTVLRAYTADE